MILVTGGTGLIGSHLLYFLLKENKKVRAIHRNTSDIASVKKVFALYTPEAESLFQQIEWFEADILDIPALGEAFEKVTEVYHCAAYINFDPSKYKILKKTNVEGTANVVNQCLLHKVKKLCYVSSVATLGSNTGDQPITEETAWNANKKNSVYAITKYGAEMEVWRGTQEGINAVIVNPGIVLGTAPEVSGSGLIIALGGNGIPFYPAGAMGMVDVKDVIKAMVQLMESDIKNERFILVGENISYRKLLSELAPLFGKKPPKWKLSKTLMFFLSFVDWLSQKVFQTKRRIPKATVRSMFTTSRYDATKIKKALAFKFTPASETFERVAKEAQDGK